MYRIFNNLPKEHILSEPGCTGALVLWQLLACGTAARPDGFTASPSESAVQGLIPAMAAANASASAGNDTSITQPLLTTREGRIVDENGTEVVLNGLGWWVHPPYSCPVWTIRPGNAADDYACVKTADKNAQMT